jgi:hypothetical protein
MSAKPEYPRAILDAMSTADLARLMIATVEAGFPEDRWFVDLLCEEIKRRKPNEKGPDHSGPSCFSAPL